MKTHYTVSEFAEKLGVTSRHVRRLCKDGEIPGAYKTSLKPKAQWRIPKETGDKFLAILGRE